jgi:hypothetical protein
VVSRAKPVSPWRPENENTGVESSRHAQIFWTAQRVNWSVVAFRAASSAVSARRPGSLTT